MSRVVADLHVHTTRSDGAVSPETLPHIAANRGLKAVAITDHDRLPPTRQPVRSAAGVAVIAGIELRVEAGQVGRVDLLGYGLEVTESLADEIDRLQRNRIDRAERMAEQLETELSISLELDFHTGIGRPHIASAVAAQTELSRQTVFDRYIGDDGPCYVPRAVPSFETGVDLLREANGLVVLAHPLRYDDPTEALTLVDQLDGVELAYPYPESVDLRPLEPVRERSSVVLTGGSDAHTIDEIGRCGLGRIEYEHFAARLPIPMD